MAMPYTLILTGPGGSGSRDVAQLAQSVGWSGNIRQIARELRVSLAVPRDGSVELPALEEGAALAFQAEGKARFTGQVLQCAVSTQNPIVNLTALDGGRFLAGNQGWFQFRDADAAGAAAKVCGEFGIPVGKLAGGGKITRKFAGVDLDKIISTIYTLAGEQTGKRYLARFTGEGALEVVEKPAAASLEIVQTMGVANAWDISSLCNSAAIRTKDGKLLRRVEDAPSQALNGRLEHIVTETKGKDAAAEAQAWLADHGLQQSLTVQVLDPPLELISGEAVLLRDTGSGASGLFWVDSDAHTWKDGQHYGKFRLNFRNLAGTVKAGADG